MKREARKMQEIQYKRFSWDTHKKNWQLKKPNVCQFELTFRCGLNCNYCYASCYNKPGYIKNELNTEQIKSILDKIYSAGVIWLCFTGGDPLERSDFLDIYSYAKDKGFIITIFTNGYSMTEEIADYLVKKPPFVIEITLNGVTKETYERISGIKDSFEKTTKGLNLILERKLPLKLKTQVTKDNLQELPKIKEFIENLGLKFRPSVFLHARLNGDLTPCSLRVKPEKVLHAPHSTSQALPHIEEDNTCYVGRDTCYSTLNNSLFNCAIGGGDGINIDPYGNTFPCICIREPKINLLQESVEKAQKIILDWVRSRTFTSDSKCKTCSIRKFCYNCPGKAWLEKGNLEEPIEWFCKLAYLIANRQKTTTKLLNC